jgi:hypothetical protein
VPEAETVWTAARGRVEMDVTERSADSPFPDVTGTTPFDSDTGELTWDKGGGIATINSQKTRALVAPLTSSRHA